MDGASSTVRVAFDELAQKAAGAQNTSGTSSDGPRLTSSIASKLKKLVRSAGTSTGPSIHVPRLLSLDDMAQLEETFARDGGPRFRTLPAAYFAELVVDRLRQPGSAGLEYSKSELTLAVHRWCAAFAKPRTAKVKHGGMIVRRSATTLSTDKISLATSAMGLGSTLLDELTVSWSDFTGHMLEQGQQRALVEDAQTSYKRQPKVPSGSMAMVGVPMRTASTAPQRRRYFEHTEHRHDVAPSCCELSGRRQTLLTGGRDGVVKEWDMNGGAFLRNLYHCSPGWITGMHYVDDHDHSLLVASSTSRIALTHVTQDTAGVVREFIGTNDANGVPRSITQASTAHTQRYGAKPGDYGSTKITLRGSNEEAREDFLHRLQEAAEDQQTRVVPVTPIVGMTGSTAFWHMGNGSCCYGSSTGRVGFFSLRDQLDLYSNTLATDTHASVQCNPALQHHTELVTSIRYSRRHSTVLTGSLDGTIFRHDVEANQLTPTTQEQHGHPRAVTGLAWCEKQQLLCSSGPDGRIRLWSLLRPEPQHVINVGVDAVHMSVHSARDQLLVLTATQQLKVFDLRSMRCLETLEGGGRFGSTATAAVAGNTPARSQLAMSDNYRHGVVAHDRITHQVVTVIDRPVLLQDMGSSAAAAAATTVLTGHKLKGQRKKASAHTSSIVALFWNEKADTLYSACRDSISAWDVDNGENLWSCEVAKQLGVINGATVSAIVHLGFRARTAQLFTLHYNGDYVVWNGLNGHVLEYLSSSVWAPPRSQMPPSADFTAVVDNSSFIGIAYGPKVFVLPADREPLMRQHAELVAAEEKRRAAQEAAMQSVHGAAAAAGDKPATTPRAPPSPRQEPRAAARVPVPVFAAGSNVQCLCQCKTDLLVAGTTGGAIYLFNTATRSTTKIELTGCDEDSATRAVLAAAAAERALGETQSSVEAVCWSNMEQRGTLFCLQTDGRVTVILLSTRKVIGTFGLVGGDDGSSGAQFITASLTSDEGYLVVGDSVGRIHVIDVFMAHEPRRTQVTGSYGSAELSVTAASPRRGAGGGIGRSMLSATVTTAMMGISLRQATSVGGFGESSTFNDGLPDLDGADEPLASVLRPRITVSSKKASQRITRQVPLKTGEAPAQVNLKLRQSTSPATQLQAVSDTSPPPPSGNFDPAITVTGGDGRSTSQQQVPSLGLPGTDGGRSSSGATKQSPAAAVDADFCRTAEEVVSASSLEVTHVAGFTASDEGITAVVHIMSRGAFISTAFDGTMRMWSLDRRVATFTADFHAGSRPRTTSDRRWSVITHFPNAAPSVADPRPTVPQPENEHQHEDTPSVKVEAEPSGAQAAGTGGLGPLDAPEDVIDGATGPKSTGSALVKPSQLGVFLTEAPSSSSGASSFMAATAGPRSPLLPVRRASSKTVPKPPDPSSRSAQMPRPPAVTVDPLSVATARIQRVAPHLVTTARTPTTPNAGRSEADDRRQEASLRLAAFRERRSAQQMTSSSAHGWTARATSRLVIPGLADTTPSKRAQMRSTKSDDHRSAALHLEL